MKRRESRGSAPVPSRHSAATATDKSESSSSTSLFGLNLEGHVPGAGSSFFRMPSKRKQTPSTVSNASSSTASSSLPPPPSLQPQSHNGRTGSITSASRSLRSSSSSPRLRSERPSITSASSFASADGSSGVNYGLSQPSPASSSPSTSADIFALQSHIASLEQQYAGLDATNVSLRRSADMFAAKCAELEKTKDDLMSELENLSVELFQEANTMVSTSAPASEMAPQCTKNLSADLSCVQVAEERKNRSKAEEEVVRLRGEITQLTEELASIRRAGPRPHLTTGGALSSPALPAFPHSDTDSGRNSPALSLSLPSFGAMSAGRSPSGLNGGGGHSPDPDSVSLTSATSSSSRKWFAFGRGSGGGTGGGPSRSNSEGEQHHQQSVHGPSASPNLVTPAPVRQQPASSSLQPSTAETSVAPSMAMTRGESTNSMRSLSSAASSFFSARSGGGGPAAAWGTAVQGLGIGSDGSHGEFAGTGEQQGLLGRRTQRRDADDDRDEIEDEENPNEWSQRERDLQTPLASSSLASTTQGIQSLSEDYLSRGENGSLEGGAKVHPLACSPSSELRSNTALGSKSTRSISPSLTIDTSNLAVRSREAGAHQPRSSSPLMVTTSVFSPDSASATPGDVDGSSSLDRHIPSPPLSQPQPQRRSPRPAALALASAAQHPSRPVAIHSFEGDKTAKSPKSPNERRWEKLAGAIDLSTVGSSGNSQSAPTSAARLSPASAATGFAEQQARAATSTSHSGADKVSTSQIPATAFSPLPATSSFSNRPIAAASETVYGSTNRRVPPTPLVINPRGVAESPASSSPATSQQQQQQQHYQTLPRAAPRPDILGSTSVGSGITGSGNASKSQSANLGVLPSPTLSISLANHQHASGPGPKSGLSASNSNSSLRTPTEEHLDSLLKNLEDMSASLFDDDDDDEEDAGGGHGGVDSHSDGGRAGRGSQAPRP